VSLHATFSCTKHRSADTEFAGRDFSVSLSKIRFLSELLFEYIDSMKMKFDVDFTGDVNLGALFKGISESFESGVFLDTRLFCRRLLQSVSEFANINK
jgi:hypothetical protein